EMLWRQASTGSLVLWQMNGSNIVNTANVIVGDGGPAVTPDASWSVAGSGDFDGDGNADLLWRQSSTGSLAVWDMIGAGIKDTGIVTFQGNPIAPDASWNIVEIADFNGDGNTDLLWRQSTTGTLSEWTMNGSQIVSTSSPSSQGSAVSP